jgi:hypothetical protein
MPLGRDDARQEFVERIRLVEMLCVEAAKIPVVQNIADVEDDGTGRDRIQPWRALKRRFVLLMT